MALTPSELRSIKDAFNKLAKESPDADKPALGMGGKMLTLKELADAIENETPVGKAMLQMLEWSVRKDGIEKTVARIVAGPPKP